MATVTRRSWVNKGGERSERYRVTFFDGSQRVRKDFPTKRQANKFIETIGLSQIRGALPQARPVDKSPTFKEVTVRYIAACARGRDGGSPLEPVTISGYEERLKNHVLPVLGDRKIASITAQDIRKFRDGLLASGAARVSCRKGLFLVKAIFKFAVSEDIIPATPAADIAIRADRRSEATKSKAVEIYSKEEVSAILRAGRDLAATAGRGWIRSNVMLHIMIYTGMRMSELRGMPADAFSFATNTIKVYQRADRDGRIGAPKSKYGYRTIHIPPAVGSMLNGWLAGRKTGLAFPTRSGQAIDLANLTVRMWGMAIKEAGVRYLNPHSARHFFASMMIDGGMRLKALQDTLGHHDPMFTMKVYGHLFQDAEDIALRDSMAARMAQTLTEGDIYD